MRLDEACRATFARHETFHPRYGWVKKAFDAAELDPNLFNREDAVVTMGVGKNMVRSIRHWGHAFKVLESAPIPGSRRPVSQATPLGRALFGEDGADPFCEVPGTQWLLHWWLLAPSSHVPVWWLAFNEFPALEFEEEQLQQFVLDRVSDWANPQASSVKKDVSCLLRMYASGQNVRATYEDRIDCPFRELGLIIPSASTVGGFRFDLGPKPGLPPLVLAATVMDFLARSESVSRTVNLGRAATEAGSPGRAFKLTEDDVLAALEEAGKADHGFGLISAAGVPQLHLSDEPAKLHNSLLSAHFREYGITYHAPTYSESGSAA